MNKNLRNQIEQAIKDADNGKDILLAKSTGVLNHKGALPIRIPDTPLGVSLSDLIKNINVEGKGVRGWTRPFYQLKKSLKKTK